MKYIFVSSTFDDLNKERSFINRDIRIEVNNYTRKTYGEEYHFIDLRLGVEDKESYQVINTCLKRLKSAEAPHPYVVILGNRYGWEPTPEIINKAKNSLNDEDADIKKVLSFGVGKSITEMEILLGAYGVGRPESEITTHKKRTVFIFTSSAEDHPKQKQLKDRIRKDFPNQIIDLSEYTLSDKDDYTEFKKNLISKIEDIVSNAFCSVNLDENEIELKKHQEYRNLKAAGFCGRKNVINDIENKMRCNGKSITDFTYVYGETGSGKSSLVSKISKIYEKNIEVLPLYCGLTQRSDSALELVTTIVYFLKSILNKNDEPLNLLYSDPIKEYNHLCDLYENDKNTKELLIIIDAIDQLLPDSYAEDLVFLPKNSYKKLKFLFSGTYDGDTIRRHYFGFRSTDNICFESYKLGSISEDEIEDIVCNIFSKELNIGDVSAKVVDHIKQYSISTPLYLNFILQRIASISEEEVMYTQQGGKLNSEFTRDDAFINIIDNFVFEDGQLLSMEKLSVKLLSSICNQIDQRYFDLLKHIAISKHGLPLPVIKKLYGEGFKEISFNKLCYLLNRVFFEHSDKCIDFTHQCFRKKLLESIGDEVAKREYHKRIFDILRKEDDASDIKRKDFAYHAIFSKQYSFLYSYASKNTIKKSDSPQKRKFKEENLNLMAASLVNYDPSLFFDNYSILGSLKLAWIKFCTDYLVNHYSLSYTHSEYCICLFECILRAYSFFLEHQNNTYISDYEIENKCRKLTLSKYLSAPTFGLTLKQFFNSRTPLVFCYDALCVVKRYASFIEKRKYQFNFGGYDRCSDINLLIIEHFKRFAYVWSEYLINEYSGYYDDYYCDENQMLYNFMNSDLNTDKIENQSYEAVEDNMRLLCYYEDKSKDALYGSIIEMINEGIGICAHFENEWHQNIVDDEKYTVNKIIGRLNFYKKEVGSQNSGKYLAEEYVVFIYNNISHYVEIESDKNSIRDTCVDLLDFLKKYLTFYGLHVSAFEAINYCLKGILISFASDDTQRYSVLRQYYYDVADFFIDFYINNYTDSLSVVANVVESVFKEFFEIINDCFLVNTSDLSDEYAEWQIKYCELHNTHFNLFYPYGLNFQSFNRLLKKYVTLLKETGEMCKNSTKFEHYSDECTKCFLKSVDKFLSVAEKQSVNSFYLKTIDWILNEKNIGYLSENEAFSYFKDDLLSLREYSNEFKEAYYYNFGETEHKKFSWKRKNKVVIK